MTNTGIASLSRDEFNRLILEKVRGVSCDGVKDSIEESLTITDKEGVTYTLNVGDRFYAKDRFGECFYEFAGRKHGYELLLINLREPRDFCQTWVTSEWWGQRKITPKGVHDWAMALLGQRG